MCSRFPELALALALAIAGFGFASDPAKRELRICADPNNLPFSNRRLEGFENRIAALLAEDLGATARYTWWPQRRGFLRNTLRAGTCDVVMGAPTGWEEVATTRPYYRSSYVFVYRSASGLAVHSLDDPVLRRVTIGVHMIGDDYYNTPPAHALAQRGIVRNVVGYSIYGDYSEENPPARLTDAVASGAVDVAVVWGPFAGYAAKQRGSALTLVPIPADGETPFPFAYEISVATRTDDRGLRQELDRALEHRRAEISRILDDYGVPRVATAVAAAHTEARP